MAGSPGGMSTSGVGAENSADKGGSRTSAAKWGNAVNSTTDIDVIIDVSVEKSKYRMLALVVHTPCFETHVLPGSTGVNQFRFQQLKDLGFSSNL